MAGAALSRRRRRPAGAPEVKACDGDDSATRRPHHDAAGATGTPDQWQGPDGFQITERRDSSRE